MWNRTELEVDNYYYMVAIEFIKYYIVPKKITKSAPLLVVYLYLPNLKILD